jgi:hypothetical protein
MLIEEGLDIAEDLEWKRWSLQTVRNRPWEACWAEDKALGTMGPLVTYGDLRCKLRLIYVVVTAFMNNPNKTLNSGILQITLIDLIIPERTDVFMTGRPL